MGKQSASSTGSGTRALGLALAAVLGVAVIAVALDRTSDGGPRDGAPVAATQRPEVVPDPSPTRPFKGAKRTAGYTPQRPAEAGPVRVLLRNGVDGYEVTVPTRFGTPSRPHPGVITYRLEGRPFTISVGDTSGNLYVCAYSCVHSTRCQSTCNSGAPPVRTLDDLQELLISVPDPMGLPLGETHSDGYLGGVPARVENVSRPGGYLLGPPAWYRVFAVHEGRPVVLTFDYWSTRNGTISRGELVSIIASFHFLDERRVGARLETYVNRAEGYRIDLPPAWIATARPSTGNSRWTDFRRGLEDPDRSVLRVTVGSTDGYISLCDGRSCGLRHVTTIDELGSLVQSNPPGYPSTELRGTYVLGQDVASFEKPLLGHRCLGCLLTYYNVYGLHDGRPFVVRLDWWAVQWNELGVPRAWDLVNRIVDSLEFIEPLGDGSSLRTYASRTAGYSLRVPSSWVVRESDSRGLPGPVTFQLSAESGTAAYGVMSISVGSRDGRVRVCRLLAVNRASACRTVHGDTLRELAVALDSAPDPLVSERSREIRLGGERGWIESPVEVPGMPPSYCGPNAVSAHHAFAFHKGRPIVLRIDYCRTLYPRDLVDRILEGFRFVD